MGLLTIGAFARAARLSRKALRLYDELGLLPPARVDPTSGYRFYSPEQLERAHLVAWLRRLGMPLARIREVCELAAPEAAREIQGFWYQVEAETSSRRELAAFLVDHLSGKGPTVTPEDIRLTIRCAALSDTGLVRESNQDSVHADARLLAVADGFGPGGAPASAAAIDVMRRLDIHSLTAGSPAGGLLNVLAEAVEDANSAVRGIADAARNAAASPDSAGARHGTDTAPPQAAHPAPASAPATEVGTTLTALFLNGSQLALVHIGDSRAHLLRDGELFRITHDHTLVQSMIDDGRLTPEEADSHPQRSLLVRALFGGEAHPDLRLREARAGDRYLLCSDGLPAAVPSAEVHRVLTAGGTPEDTVRELIALARASGAPDNVSCVVADVTATAAEAPPESAAVSAEAVGQ
ncbi:MerR family transcriptional regulator [Streptomyces tsukubensis]|uniref:MerR family transcriptional regulator n=1 Tax=Streptomyces tsukubensis TaxID=83656 RepID=A0A1V4AF01_9ACTN|nr:MerR family transcriptional regulator [Streptomyces tsukubensis]OON82619.1 hypothetical protein B1H18_00680 [Streptomyces tsukubensis]QFR92209.1 MerR family transcriptional regulator [Streptomyces tsukubensis]